MEVKTTIANGHPPTWMIWANPIVRRYARSRLRPRGLGITLLITILIAGFMFFMSRAVGLYRADLSVADAERGPLIPLLVFQGLILFVLATGQVAGAMTAEADEGVLDYQRLAPMTPLAKVLGYLFGLPIREYVLFLATMPFTLWGLWRGEVPLATGVQLYGVFLIAAILYHLTGLVAGTVLKNRRWAFLVSMGLVFLLYTVLPQAAKFGLVYFKYLTIQPVFMECLPDLIRRDVGAGIQTVQNLLPPARFFNLDFPQAAFTIATQAVLILALGVMLWRRWHRAESHLLGKAGATGLFAWVQLMLIGNALPLIDPGDVFPSQGVRRYLQFRNVGYEWQPEAAETIFMTGAFGIVTLAMLWMFTMLMTPERDGQIRGWRRARKLGQRSLALASDPATSFPWVALMVALGAGGWFWFTKEVIESRWFPGAELPIEAFGAFLIVVAAGGFGYHALLESKGRRAAGLTAILIGVLPILVGTILAASSDRLIPLATWLVGISPAAGPLYATGTVLPIVDLPADLMRSIPRAFWFWQAVGTLVTLNLIVKLRRTRVAIARETSE